MAPVASRTASHRPLQAGAHLGARPARPGLLARRRARLFYLWVSPWMLGFLVFHVGAMLFSLALSFMHWPVFGAPRFVGAEQYFRMVHDPLFWRALQVTATFTLLNVPLSLVAGLAVAVLMNQRVRGTHWLCTVCFLPRALTGISVAYLWTYIFNPQFGLMNRALGLFHIAGPEWLFSRTWVIPAFVIMDLWSSSGGMLTWLAALQDVPRSLYEVASLDGAGVLRKFFTITLPMIPPIVFFNLIMSIIHSFEVFSNVYVMTAGGPGHASLSYVLYLFQEGFEAFHFGYASALAWALFAIVIGLTLLVVRSTTLWVYYEGELSSGGKKA